MLLFFILHPWLSSISSHLGVGEHLWPEKIVRLFISQVLVSYPSQHICITPLLPKVLYFLEVIQQYQFVKKKKQSLHFLL